MSLKDKIKHIYETKYKWLMLITFSIVLLSLLQICLQAATTGDFVNKGITLKGGSTITITKEYVGGEKELQTYLQQQFTAADISVRTMSAAGKTVALAVDSDIQEDAGVQNLIQVLTEKLNLQKEDYSVEVMGSALGDSFFRQLILALLTAFALMGIVVFIYFRVPVPSIAVIAAGFSDIIVTLAIFNLTGMKLGTAGIAAFLMLIGYSVDTDILLTSRVLKRKEGTVMDRIYGAITTGMTMTWTTIAAVTVALLLIKSDTIKQIMFIIFIGLFVDMLMTWVQNVGILRWYL